MELQLLNAPGIQTERGRPVRTSSFGDSIYYINRNKVLKVNLKTRETRIFPIQNLKLSCVESFKENEFICGDDSGDLIHFDETSSSATVLKAIFGQINSIKVIGYFILVAGCGQKFQAKAFNLNSFVSGKVLEEIFIIKSSAWPISCIVHLEDDMFAIGKEDGYLLIYDEDRLIGEHLVDKSTINDLYYDGLNEIIYFGTLTRAMGCFSVQEKEVIFLEKNLFGGAVYNISSLSDKKYIVSCSGDSMIRLWRVGPEGPSLLYDMKLANELQKPDLFLGMHVTQGNQALAFTLHGSQILLNPIGTNSTVGVQTKLSFHKTPIVYAWSNEDESQWFTIDSEGKVNELMLDNFSMRQIFHINREVLAARAVGSRLIYGLYNSVGKIDLLDLKENEGELVKVSQGVRSIHVIDGTIILYSEKALTTLDFNLKVIKELKFGIEICSGICVGDRILCGDKSGSLLIFDINLLQIDKTLPSQGSKITAFYHSPNKEIVIAGLSTSQLLFMNSSSFAVG
jgi:hypothetical protein